MHKFHEIITGACNAEKDFVNDVLVDPVLGFNSGLMVQYVEYMGDFLCSMLDFDKLYNTPNPLEWMDLQALECKTNFFESRVSEYSKTRTADRIFSVDADF